MARYARIITAGLAGPILALGLAACSAKSNPPGPSTTASAPASAPASSPTSAPASSTTTSSTTPSTTTTSAATTTSTAGPAGVYCNGGKPGSSTTIVIHNLTYLTCPDTVSPGATITVKNTDAITHTVTATGAHKGAFNTGYIQGGATTTFKAPTKPGTYRYMCVIHPFMHGTLIVR